jgi:hypothetical protein
MRRQEAKRGKALENKPLVGLVCCIQGVLAYIPATETAGKAAQIQDFKE